LNIIRYVLSILPLEGFIVDKQQPDGAGNTTVGTIVMLVLFGFFVKTCFFPSEQTKATQASNTADELANEQVREIGRQMGAERDAWLPSTGFDLTNVVTDIRGRPVKAGIKWLSQGQYSCDYGQSCWGLEVIAIDPCQSLYAEIAILNRGGANIGMANDSAVGSAALQRVQFVFHTFESSAHSADLVKIVCR
jgi:hypothetical protein